MSVPPPPSVPPEYFSPVFVAFRETVVLILTVGSFPEESTQSDHSSGLMPTVLLNVLALSPVELIVAAPDW